MEQQVTERLNRIIRSDKNIEVQMWYMERLIFTVCGKLEREPSSPYKDTYKIAGEGFELYFLPEDVEHIGYGIMINPWQEKK